ncbi:unnamed protein product [Closterium sp. Yama58-4]|nr:unnamed protein product [Closterium sp. Yama58-4]
MTVPGTADRAYVAPMTLELVEQSTQKLAFSPLSPFYLIRIPFVLTPFLPSTGYGSRRLVCDCLPLLPHTIDAALSLYPARLSVHLPQPSRSHCSPIQPLFRVIANERPDALLPTMGGQTALNLAVALSESPVIANERPDALLPTMGGQTALNLAVALSERGTLDKYGVELIGAKLDAINKAEDRDLFKRAMDKLGIKSPKSGTANTLQAINKAEDRDLFKRAMDKLGIKSPKSGTANTLQECFEIAKYIGDYPMIIRPAFTLGGSGGGIAYNEEEFETICKAGLSASATSQNFSHLPRRASLPQVLIDKSLLGWKEYELEVMRDLADNVVIICSIENIDPMGVHTGDSITVAPAQTLTDKEYQWPSSAKLELNVQFAINPKDGERLRDYSVAIIREIGVECGGSNVQFAINPKDGEVVVIEMNPRVSRSSALASKATGFPIAKMAAKLSVGYTLDRIPNDITKKTPASFEPSIDYVVTKVSELSSSIPNDITKKTPASFEPSIDYVVTKVSELSSSIPNDITKKTPASFEPSIDYVVTKVSELSSSIPNDITKKTPASFEPSIDYVVTKVSELSSSIPNDITKKTPASFEPSIDYVVTKVSELSSSIPNDITKKTPASFEPSIDYVVTKVSELSSSIPNDITKKTPASFEPSIDYVVTKIPRFAFEKFPGSEPTLTTQMKSVGEAMAIGRTFQESFQKALRSLETGHWGWGCEPVKQLEWSLDDLKYSMRVPNPDRMYAIYAAMKRGMSQRQVQQLTSMDPWYLSQMGELLEVEDFMGKLDGNLRALTKDDMQQIKRRGYSDRQIAYALKTTEEEVRSFRLELGVVPAFKRVDTCAAEFEAMTPYQYSSYDEENEGQPDAERKVLILGGGPNRIGQGIEFDYCCCHASFALQAAGFETIMMNSNPETVSTDYDTSNRLYFEPLTVEDVINVINLERPDGVIVQFGGQTPLKLAVPIQKYLENTQLQAASGSGPVRIWGTSPDSIDAAEDRKRFEAMLNELGINQPPGGIARSEEDALAVAKRVGYPVVVRPSYVLGGRAMEIVYNDEALQKYLVTAVEVDPERPVLVDKYLAYAVMPTGEVYIIEANPRASRTVPFVAKAIGHPLAKYASLIMAGKTLKELGFDKEVIPNHVSVKEAVLPFDKFPGCDVLLGPEMRSTGEVMGLDATFEKAFLKAQVAANQRLPTGGSVFVSLNDLTKESGVEVAKSFVELGFKILATEGTANVLENAGIEVERVLKLHEGRPHAGELVTLIIKLLVITSSGDALDQKDGPLNPLPPLPPLSPPLPPPGDLVSNGQIQLLVITSAGDALDQKDGRLLRRTALGKKVPIITTMASARATVKAIRGLIESPIEMKALQDYYVAGSEEAIADAAATAAAAAVSH